MSNCPTLLNLAWERLSRVATLHFAARSRTASGWRGEGSGQVALSAPAAGVLVFVESGRWRAPGGATFAFANTYRWTLRSQDLRLEHLRLGPDRPVFLLDLEPAGDLLRGRAPHCCGEDSYRAALHLREGGLQLVWTVRGPAKDEQLHCAYFCAPRD